ncbi:MAG: NAD(P)H-binding protein [Armatimonadetes bacterium]|nr:NAD(P)H-binding protein [Armatimonadota bacterium]
MAARIFITGGTGYIGGRLIPALIQRGHSVRALVRESSASKLAAGAVPVVGNALDASTFFGAISPDETVIHLVGTPHPGPGKGEEFRKVDLASIQASVKVAAAGGVAQFIYLSVGQPAPVMKEYIAVRAQGERLIQEAGLTATMLRPWYVLGPGHRWPIILKPIYAVASLIPATRPGAQRLGMVTLDQMVRAILHAVEHPPPTGSSVIVDAHQIGQRAMQLG